MAANAQMLSVTQWRQAFDDVIFPLFLRAEERSKIAMRCVTTWMYITYIFDNHDMDIRIPISMGHQYCDIEL